MNSNQFGGGLMTILGLFLLVFTSSGHRLYSLCNLLGVKLTYGKNDIISGVLTLGPFVGGVFLILGILIIVKGIKDSKK